MDGERFDLEMEVLHVAEETVNDIGYAAISILFDVEDYNTKVTDVQVGIINNFFDSMNWDQAILDESGAVIKTTVSDEVPIGDLLMMADMSKRFVYKGSLTVPPCTTYVYWNILRSIYPIE